MQNSTTTWRFFSLAGLALTLGCGAAEGVDETTDDLAQELEVQVTPLAVTRELMPVELPFPAGVAAASDAIFIGSPFEGRVLAYERHTGQSIGELPAPPGGFVLPFMMKRVSGGRIAVLDAGGFPSPIPFIPTNPVIYEYSYSYSASAGFSAELVRSIPFSGALIGFPEDFVELEDGRYLLDDAVLGSIWIAETDGAIVPGLVPETFEPEDAIPETYFCDTMPVVDVGGLPFLFTAATVPGITSIAARGNTVYFSASCAGAIYSIPLNSLSDSREPWERAVDIELVSPKPAAVLVEELLGMTFNPYAPDDPYLYAADALELRVIRIDPQTGQREVVADDQHLLNFPSSLAFVPPQGPGAPSPLLALSNQQHRTVILNDAIGEDVLEPPFLVTEIQPRH